MTEKQAVKAHDLRMSGKEFDRIMGQVLRVTPKASAKKKTPRKKKTARK
ncbi:MAG TPA: hypothetical protein VIJ04_13580 [Xanthobacteraceae bacterium]